jgi:hypothetical protein
LRGCRIYNRHHSTRVFGSHLDVDDGRSRKQAARFQDLLQQPSHEYLTRGANAGYNHVTTSSQPRLVSMGTTLSSPLPNTSRRLTFQRLALVWNPVNFCKQPRMKSSGVCVFIVVASVSRIRSFYCHRINSPETCLDRDSPPNVEWLSRIVKSAERLNRLERFDQPVLIPNAIL